MTVMTCFERVKRLCRALSLLLLVTGVSLFLGSKASFAKDPIRSTGYKEVYPYTMKGKVRLLFFWIGKDDVGGGTISVAEEPRPDGKSWKEEIEVLFGSKPERVPGGHNRWGYGVENAEWENRGLKAVLTRTIFQGFMRHSNEKSMSEVRDNATDGNTKGLFWYDGIRTVVLPGAAISEKHVFSTEENFDYRNPDPIQAAYQQRIKVGPPDKHKQLVNDNGTYETPYGFLTATRRMLQAILTDYQRGDDQWASKRSSLVYVHSARRYRLTVRDIDYRERFRLQIKTDGNEVRREMTFPDVAKADFRIEKIDTPYKHDFAIWFPLRGLLQGIPLRIVDKPRWWLKVELTLTPDEVLMTRLRMWEPPVAIEALR